jgi:hypothetical protein
VKTLKLFNAVKRKDDGEIFVSDDGFIIEGGAVWAKNRILDYYRKEKLSGNDLNKTFHKSWEKIKTSTRFELFVEQITHYISTYGSDFQDEIYIPDEVLDIPDVKLKYKVIKAYTKEELIDKCLAMLKSGIALTEETINDLLTVLVDELGYSFTGSEGIKNKEAVIKIADMYGVLPKDTMEFFRLMIYRATGQSLLIKNPMMIQAIKSSNFNPSAQFQMFGLAKLAEIFNRYKPLFLAFKTKCPSTINKIGRLSKVHHKPMVSNPLNLVTSELRPFDGRHWLDNATPFALFKAMAGCYSRMRGQNTFVYRIRNGKSFAKWSSADLMVCEENFSLLVDYMKERFDLTGKKIYVPDDIKYALPTSEKMFVGNVPTGTRFYGKNLAVGMYWEDGWGARDLDLSGVAVGGKVGWNADYNHGDGSLMYSGDLTSAPNGAVEYLYATDGLAEPYVVNMNVFSGNPEGSGYKIVVGRGDKVSRDYMMNPANLFAEIKTETVQRQMVLGMVIPKKSRQCFVLLNFGAGSARVSGWSEVSELYLNGLYQQWRKPLSFNRLIKLLGAEIVDDKEECEYDFSVDRLEKDSFLGLFSE